MSTITKTGATMVAHMLKEATDRVENIKNDADQHFPEAASIGDAVRQGDIYVQLVEPVTTTPMLYKLAAPSFPMQLAEGDTKGSRHCLAHGDGVKVYEPVVAQSRDMYVALAAQYGIDPRVEDLASKIRNREWELRYSGPNRTEADMSAYLEIREAIEMLGFTGPIFTLSQTNTITHPEHGNWILPPGSYRVSYQRTVTRQNTIERVLD
jgi:hypothetical protein